MPQNVPSATVKIDRKPLGGRTSELLPLRVRCETGMDGVGVCELDLIVPAGASLPTPGQPLAVALGLDGDESPVFTGEIVAVQVGESWVRVVASDARARLACTYVFASYEAQAPGKIVRDLLGQAKVDLGKAADGPELASYVVFPQVSVLRHVERLAELMGADLFVDADGKLNLGAGDAKAASIDFGYGAGLLSAALEHAGSVREGVEVWGEGAASSKGSDKAHWLPDDLGGVTGKGTVSEARKFTSAGPRVDFVQDGALRTGSAAGDAAEGRAAALDRPLRGVLEVSGAAAVAPTDVVTISALPDGHPLAAILEQGTLRVRRVRHQLDTTRGFTTRLEF
jgi:hypothetical protein